MNIELRARAYEAQVSTGVHALPMICCGIPASDDPELKAADAASGAG